MIGKQIRNAILTAGLAVLLVGCDAKQGEQAGKDLTVVNVWGTLV